MTAGGLYDDDAALYDIAFDWDVADEVAWLVGRMGKPCRSVLEPGCGSGRIVQALACTGLDVVGLDRSPAMVEIARRRLRGCGVRAEILLADMTDFRLERRFDGAACPVNTLAHLSPGALSRHLDRMAEHLRPAGRYLVQLGLHEPGRGTAGETTCWEMARGDTQLRIAWSVEGVDTRAQRARHRARIEVLAGERAGEAIEDVFDMTAWTPASWARAIARSPFELAATYDGDRPDRPPVEPGTAGPLLWHELVRSEEPSVPQRTPPPDATLQEAPTRSSGASSCRATGL